ncbi:MAG TPA: hypothetical protein VLX68_03370 [Chitinivibrionales bacterium]|nr:hypothetical protein [Chitinivibrionales bacterium]
MKLKTNIFIGLDEGQAMQGVLDQAQPAPQLSPPYATVQRLWQQEMVMYLTAAINYRERLQFILSTECDLHFSTVQPQIFPNTTRPGFFFYANDVEVNYSFGNLDMPWLRIAVGYFPVKYNPDAKNLGEYLLRCSAYPTVIVTNFEFAMIRQLGLRLSGFLGNPAIDQLKWDLMLTSESQDYPLFDGTLSAIVSNTLFDMFDIGAGVSFQRLFPVDDSKTTPKDKPLAQYTDVNGVQQAYTYSSTKVMARASVNPLRFVPQFKLPAPEFFGDKPFFGKEDLKIYGEVAVLGTQDIFAYDSFAQDTQYVNGIPVGFTNKPGTGKPVADSINYYNNWKDRVPVMAGIDLPTNPLISYGVLPLLLTKWLKDETGSDIRLLSYITLLPALASGVMDHFLGWDLGLDVMSLEFEWFSQRYPNSDFYAVNPGVNYKSPVPYPNSYRYAAGFGKPEPSKYSLYFQKNFLNKFAISGLVGRDHFRPISFVSPDYAQNDDFLQSKNHWWWMMRLSANF